jgi:hypothetical protein
MNSNSYNEYFMTCVEAFPTSQVAFNTLTTPGRQHWSIRSWLLLEHLRPCLLRHHAPKKALKKQF